MKIIFKLSLAIFLSMANPCQASDTENENDADNIPLMAAHSRGIFHDMEIVQMDPPNAHLSAEEQVFYNQDLLNIISAELDPQDLRHLALTNKTLCQKMKKIIKLEQEGALKHLFAALNSFKQINNPEDIRPLMNLLQVTKAHFFFADRSSRALDNADLRNKFATLISGYQHELCFRQAYTGLVSQEDRSTIRAIANQFDIPTPELSLIQRIRALYYGFQINRYVSGTAFVIGSSAAVSHFIFSIIYNDLITRNLTDHICQQAIYTLSSLPKTVSASELNELSVLQTAMLMCTIVNMPLQAAQILSPKYHFYPHLNLTNQPLSSLLKDPNEDPRLSELKDFLYFSQSCNWQNNFPSVHMTLYHARKLNEYLTPLLDANDRAEQGLPQVINAKQRFLAQVMINIMKHMSYCPTYQLAGGNEIKDLLLRVPGTNDNFIVSRKNKLLTLLRTDPIIKAAAYGSLILACVGVYKLPFIWHYQVGRVVGEVYQNLTYETYMNHAAEKIGCCLKAASVQLNNCPSLAPAAFKDSIFQLANTTAYIQSTSETIIYGLPLLFLFCNLFYYFLA